MSIEGYDPDYDFLHQDLSVSEPLPFPTGGSSLSPLPECHAESQSLSPAQGPAHPRFSAPVTNQASLEYWSPPLTPGPTNSVLPPALPQKKRRSAPIISAYPLYERLPSHYDNLSEEEQPTPPFPLVTPASPLPQVNGGDDFSRCTDADSPPPLPEKKGKQSKRIFLFIYF